MNQKPSLGRIVHYRLSSDDVMRIESNRQDGKGSGNSVRAGETVPMMITVVWSETCVNGQLFLDGNDSHWVTSASYGAADRQWQWPPQV